MSDLTKALGVSKLIDDLTAGQRVGGAALGGIARRSWKMSSLSLRVLLGTPPSFFLQDGALAHTYKMASGSIPI